MNEGTACGDCARSEMRGVVLVHPGAVSVRYAVY